MNTPTTTRPKHKAVFDRSTPPTLGHVAAIYGMSAKQLVLAIRDNKDGRFDRLYTQGGEYHQASPFVPKRQSGQGMLP